jgi:hypothetical protein
VPFFGGIAASMVGIVSRGVGVREYMVGGVRRIVRPSRPSSAVWAFGFSAAWQK